LGILIDAKGPDGNAYVIMAAVQSYLKQTDQRARIPMIMEAMRSSDYIFLCDLAEEITLGSVRINNRPKRTNTGLAFDGDPDEDT
jgi:hypothetical protein